MGRCRGTVTWASRLVALAALLGCATASAQIRFYTKEDFAQEIPQSVAEARARFAADASGVDGYGCTNAVPAFLDITNHAFFSAKGNLADYATIPFVVGQSEGGIWSFRVGADYGRGGTLLLDGNELKSGWYYLWWDQNWDSVNHDPPQVLEGQITLTPGLHVLEVLGFEDCCDGPTRIEYRRPGGSYLTFATSNIQIPQPSCTGTSVLVSASDLSIVPGGQVTISTAVLTLGSACPVTTFLATDVPSPMVIVSANPPDPPTMPNDPTAKMWTIGSVPAFSFRKAELVLQAPLGTPQGTVVTVTGGYGDDTNGILATRDVSIVIATPPVLGLVDGSSGTTRTPGETFAYKLQWSNSGPVAATNAKLAVKLPVGVSFVSTTDGTYDAGTRTVTATASSLANGELRTTDIVVTVDAALANDTVVAVHAQLSADYAVTLQRTFGPTVKRVPKVTVTDSPDPITSPGLLTFVITVTADAGGAAEALVDIALPAGVTYAGGCDSTGTSNVHFHAPTLAANQVEACTAAVVVGSGIADDTLLSFLATIDTAAPVPAISLTTKVLTPILDMTALDDLLVIDLSPPADLRGSDDLSVVAGDLRAGEDLSGEVDLGAEDLAVPVDLLPVEGDLLASAADLETAPDGGASDAASGPDLAVPPYHVGGGCACQSGGPVGAPDLATIAAWLALLLWVGRRHGRRA